MDASSSIAASRILPPNIRQSTSLNKKGYCLIALSIILLIGSLAAGGLMYTKLGYASFALPGGGFTLTLLTLISANYCCTHTTKKIIPGTRKTPSHPPTLLPTTKGKKKVKPEPQETSAEEESSKSSSLQKTPKRSPLASPAKERPASPVYQDLQSQAAIKKNTKNQEKKKTLHLNAQTGKKPISDEGEKPKTQFTNLDLNTIDFSQLLSQISDEDQKKIHVHTLFSSVTEGQFSAACVYFRGCKPETIYQLAPYLPTDLWKFVGGDLLKTLDFEKVFEGIDNETDRENIVSAIFHDFANVGGGNSRVYFISCPVDTLYQLSPYLPSDVWDFLSDDQRKNLDVVKLLNCAKSEAKKKKTAELILKIVGPKSIDL